MKSSGSTASYFTGDTSTSGATDSRRGGAGAVHGATKSRRLVAGQRHFGLEAASLRAGAARVLARIASDARPDARVDVRGIGEDFRLDPTAACKLVRALLAGGLLLPDGNGGYRPTPLFREYANATVVAPLSRARAKALVDKAAEIAARINAGGMRNPLVIEAVAVSGDYMSRRERLSELSLWLVLRERPPTPGRRWRSLGNDDALRRIGAAMKALSSFVVVRVASDLQKVQRPFIVAFQADGGTLENPAEPIRGRFRAWGASISRRLVPR